MTCIIYLSTLLTALTAVHLKTVSMLLVMHSVLFTHIVCGGFVFSPCFVVWLLMSFLVY